MNQQQASSLLGIAANASKAEIKKAYRKKVKSVHPDVNPSKTAHEEFVKLTDAYDVLVNGPKVAPSTSRQTSNAPQDPFVKYARQYSAPTDPAEYREWIKVAKARAKKAMEDLNARKAEDDSFILEKMRKWTFIVALFMVGISSFFAYDILFTEETHREIKTGIKADLENYTLITDKSEYKIGIDDMIVTSLMDDTIHVAKTQLGIYKDVTFYIDGEPHNYVYYNEFFYAISAGSFVSLLMATIVIVFRRKIKYAAIAFFIFSVALQTGAILTVLFGELL